MAGGVAAVVTAGALGILYATSFAAAQADPGDAFSIADRFCGVRSLARQAAARAVEAELGRRLQQAAQLIAVRYPTKVWRCFSPATKTAAPIAICADGFQSCAIPSLSRVYVLRPITRCASTLLVPRSGPSCISSTEIAVNWGKFCGGFAQSTRSVSSVLFRGHDGQITNRVLPRSKATRGGPFCCRSRWQRSAVCRSGRIAADAAFVGVLASLLLTLLALWLGRQVSLPLVRLSEGAQAVGRGVLDRPVPSELCVAMTKSRCFRRRSKQCVRRFGAR